MVENKNERIRFRKDFIYIDRVLSDQEREEKYGSRRKRYRENRATEEDPDIFKFLTKEDKLLIEDIAHALYQSRA
jgi:hypothetical protein